MSQTNHRRRLRFSLRAIFVLMAIVGVICAWVAYQLSWIRQRQAWREPSSGAVRSTESRDAPSILWMFGEQGESWIEIKDATNEQIARVKRLFPEATVVKQQPQASVMPRTTLIAPVAPLAAPQVQ